jgi:hypothetical protein
MKYLRFKKKLISKICSKIYLDVNRDIDKCMLVAGSGRSGTTWLANIISRQMPCRIMFEPFHSMHIRDYSKFHYFQYMRPAEQNYDLLLYCHKILSGNIRNKWIDREIDHILPKYRLIKDIRTNLFLKWFSNNFPNVPILYIIRHPCAVALSFIELSWSVELDITSFLSQGKLIDDFLLEKLDIIRSAKTIEERIAVFWCISNLIPLSHFSPNDLNIFFYENICAQPHIEIPRIFGVAKHQHDESVFKYLEHPSTTSQDISAIVTGESRIERWKEKLSSKQINNILSIVRSFEMDHIYGDSSMPVIGYLNI